MIHFIVKAMLLILSLYQSVNGRNPAAGEIKVDNITCKRARKLLYCGTGDFQFRFFIHVQENKFYQLLLRSEFILTNMRRNNKTRQVRENLPCNQLIQFEVFYNSYSVTACLTRPSS